MNHDYKITEIDIEFVETAINRLEDSFLSLEFLAKKFNENAVLKTSKYETIDPFTKQKRKYKYPLAFDLWKMYYFATSRIADESILEIEESIKAFHDMIYENPFISDYYYKVDQKNLVKTPEGFLYYVSDLKLKLLTGEDFAAHELACMIGVSNQAITHRINREKTISKDKLHKVGNRYIIPNNIARIEVANSDSPLYKGK